MLNEFSQKKFIVKVLIKAREAHFKLLLLLALFDSTSVEHSSRPSFVDTSITGCDGLREEGTNDGSDPRIDGRDIAY